MYFAPMFNLNQAIAEWRKHMFAAGITVTAHLDALESHLRDEVGRQTESGLSRPGSVSPGSSKKLDHPRQFKTNSKRLEKKQASPRRRLLLTVLFVTPEILTQAVAAVVLQSLFESGVWIAGYWERQDSSKAQGTWKIFSCPPTVLGVFSHAS